MNLVEKMNIKDWKEHVFSCTNMQNIASINAFLTKEKKNKVICYPPEDKIFAAFQMTDFLSLKAVILGQSPYHNQKQANGLSFSVNRGLKIPPSLRNIYKEISRDFSLNDPLNGDLSYLARNGVLLLNASLTVEHLKPTSHQKIGWEQFTNDVLSQISLQKQNIVFFLWGNFAIKAAKLIDSSKHLVLTTTHPSPLSAYKGFLGCNHFVLCNKYLKQNNISEIEWGN